MKVFSLKSSKIIYSVVFCLLLTGCSFNWPPRAAAESITLSGWIVYWDDQNGEKDLAKVKNRLKNLSFFAAYFDENDELFLPKQIVEQKEKIDKENIKYKKFLTIVNDQKNADGKISLKDTDLLERLFADEARMQKNIDEVIDLVKKNGYDGVEIDYERIWVNEKTGYAFSRFINKLAYQAIKEDIRLRVVLEPGIPFGKTDFAKGPEYVVMLYNLYGTHSGPGPKADSRFIQRTINKMFSGLPETRAVAFSTGGALWGSDGSKKFITQEEAEALCEKHSAESEIDSASHARHFQYDENGHRYTVWYADEDTLNHWLRAARLAGIEEVSIWRLGGNRNLNKLIER